MSSYIKIFAPDTPEYARLNEAAALMTEKSPNHWRYYVDETYFDFGQGWKWTTIICKSNSEYTGMYETYQALCPRDHERIILTEDSDALAAVVADVFADKYCPDVVARYIVTYSPDDGSGQPSQLSTYWATMARSTTQARKFFQYRFPQYHIREVELADETLGFAYYGNGWFTEEEQQAQRERLNENYATARDERKEAEQIVTTYEPDEFAAAVAYRERREQEKTQNLEGVHVGDLFYVMWGYEQTNYNFFQVVGLRGKHTIVVRENQTSSAAYGNMCGLARPIRNQFRGEQRYTLRTRFDERLQHLWIKSPDGFGTGHGLYPCEDGKTFEYTTYA